MARYRLHAHHYRRAHKFFKWVKVFSISCLVLVVLTAILISADSLLQRRQAAPKNDTTAETKTSFYPSNQIFRTAFFQIQTPNTWISIPNESTGNKFVYRSMDKTLVQQELDILVNASPLSLGVTHSLPVEVNGSSLTPKQVSDPCGSLLLKTTTNRSPQQMTLNGVQITCIPDSNDYSVLVGVSNGSTSIKMQRPDNSLAAYQFLYRNLTVNPDPRDLISILTSFQTR